MHINVFTRIGEQVNPLERAAYFQGTQKSLKSISEYEDEETDVSGEHALI
jgi:hypothetical protein